MKNRLRMISKVRNVRLGVFSGGGCHDPNILLGLVDHQLILEGLLGLWPAVCGMQYPRD